MVPSPGHSSLRYSAETPWGDLEVSVDVVRQNLDAMKSLAPMPATLQDFIDDFEPAFKTLEEFYEAECVIALTHWRALEDRVIDFDQNIRQRKLRQEVKSAVKLMRHNLKCLFASGKAVPCRRQTLHEYLRSVAKHTSVPPTMDLTEKERPTTHYLPPFLITRNNYIFSHKVALRNMSEYLEERECLPSNLEMKAIMAPYCQKTWKERNAAGSFESTYVTAARHLWKAIIGVPAHHSIGKRTTVWKDDEPDPDYDDLDTPAIKIHWVSRRHRRFLLLAEIQTNRDIPARELKDAFRYVAHGRGIEAATDLCHAIGQTINWMYEADLRYSILWIGSAALVLWLEPGSDRDLNYSVQDIHGRTSHIHSFVGIVVGLVLLGNNELDLKESQELAEAQDIVQPATDDEF